MNKSIGFIAILILFLGVVVFTSCTGLEVTDTQETTIVQDPATVNGDHLQEQALARPTGRSVADQKVSFFYNSDELITLKANILGRAASWINRNG